MRWKIAHLLVATLVIALGLAIYRALWGVRHFDAKIVFGVYVSMLSVATVGAFEARPRWRRLWRSAACFGWAWLLLVLRNYLDLMTPDLFMDNFMAYCWLGIALAAITGIVGLFLPGMS